MIKRTPASVYVEHTRRTTTTDLKALASKLTAEWQSNVDLVAITSDLDVLVADGIAEKQLIRSAWGNGTWKFRLKGSVA